MMPFLLCTPLLITIPYCLYPVNRLSYYPLGNAWNLPSLSPSPLYSGAPLLLPLIANSLILRILSPLQWCLLLIHLPWSHLDYSISSTYSYTSCSPYTLTRNLALSNLTTSSVSASKLYHNTGKATFSLYIQTHSFICHPSQSIIQNYARVPLLNRAKKKTSPHIL